MNVLQGRYSEAIRSKRGKLKGFKIETDDGVQTVYLPKALRAIATQELAVGDTLRVWTAQRSASAKSSRKASKHTNKKKDKKAKAKSSQGQSPSRGGAPEEALEAIQLIPLSPKASIAQEKPLIPASSSQSADSKLSDAKKIDEKSDSGRSQPKKAKAAKKLKPAKKKKSAKTMTVQLCQKKNCCKRGGTKLWVAFESANTEAKNTTSAQPFKLESVGCLGGCKHGPNIRFLPDNVKHYHVQPKDVDTLLAKHGLAKHGLAKHGTR